MSGVSRFSIRFVNPCCIAGVVVPFVSTIKGCRCESLRLLFVWAALFTLLFATSARSLTVEFPCNAESIENFSATFIAEGRIGNNTPVPGNAYGTYEVAVSQTTPGPFIEGETAHFVWQTGKKTPFVLRYDADDGIAVFSVDNTNVCHILPEHLQDSTDILLRVQSTRKESGILLHEMELDGEAITNMLGASQSLGELNALRISNISPTNSFELRGYVTMTFPSGARRPQNKQLGFKILVGRMPPAPVADTDGDGIPDYWEEEYFGGPVGAGADEDADGDGMTNLEEFIAGTNPTDPRCAFRVVIDKVPPPAQNTRASDASGDGSVVQLEWPTVSNRTYIIWRATRLEPDMRNFEKIAEITSASLPWNMFQDTTATNSARYFYRIQIKH